MLRYHSLRNLRVRSWSTLISNHSRLLIFDQYDDGYTMSEVNNSEIIISFSPLNSLDINIIL